MFTLLHHKPLSRTTAKILYNEREFETGIQRTREKHG